MLSLRRLPIRRRPRLSLRRARRDRAKAERPSASAAARLVATETGSGRIRAYPAVPDYYRPDAVELSLIAAHQRGTGVRVCLAAPAASWCRITWLVT
jgi:hypothetical protein